MNQADESNSQTAMKSDCAWWGMNETLIFVSRRHKGAAVFGEQIKKKTVFGSSVLFASISKFGFNQEKEVRV